MSESRVGLVLPVSRLWVMSLPFRLVCRACTDGFAPGARNLIEYEVRRLWHRIYERERIGYHLDSLYSLISRTLRKQSPK
jgi:hypothetical protein